MSDLERIDRVKRDINDIDFTTGQSVGGLNLWLREKNKATTSIFSMKVKIMEVEVFHSNGKIADISMLQTSRVIKA